MRVRQLQTHLQETGLVHQSKMSNLQGMKIGLDAAFWLRSIQKLKDPFADALGGMPPGLFGMLERELEQFKKQRITPVFVFEGIVPPLQSQAFQLTAIHAQLDTAWNHIARGARQDAQKVFAVSTSRINADIEHIVFHHLKSLGVEVMRSPYFVGAQLMHLAESGLIQAVVGPPGLLLYGVPKVILLLDFPKQSFEWTDLQRLLSQWGLNQSQFVDACLLAGTEYCLTYPYLNLEPFQAPGKGFRFEVAVEFIRNHSLINWMQSLSTEEMRRDYVEGYCLCKALIRHSPVLDVSSMKVRPISDRYGQPCPSDLPKIVGCRLRPAVYALMCTGLLSHRLPAVLATSEWNDRHPPLVDSQEYRSLLFDLQDYREKALGMVAAHCDSAMHRRNVSVQYFFHARPNGTQESETYTPQLPSELGISPWHVTKKNLEAEKQRQGSSAINLRFCLTWHSYAVEHEGDLLKPGPPEISDEQTLAAVVQFTLLQQIGMVGPDRDMTVLGDVLKDCQDRYQEPCLFALELMKFGLLCGEPFEPVQDKPFPAAVHYPPVEDKTTKMVTLITRVASLYPMRLKSDMWNAEVDFDLAAFHSMVRPLKRALRQLTEACLADLLLQDLRRVKMVPAGAMSAQREGRPEKPGRPEKAPPEALLPNFSVSRACTGIVLKYILTIKTVPDADLRSALRREFPCCTDALRDIQHAIYYWKEVLRCVEKIAEPLEAADLLADMRAADTFLELKLREYGLAPTPDGRPVHH